VLHALALALLARSLCLARHLVLHYLQQHVQLVNSPSLELQLILRLVLVLTVLSVPPSQLLETSHHAQRAQLVPLPLLQVNRLVLEPTLAALARERSLAHHQLQMAVRIAAQGRISLLLVTYQQHVLLVQQERLARLHQAD
jgi:hypothetical protein